MTAVIYARYSSDSPESEDVCGERENALHLQAYKTASFAHHHWQRMTKTGLYGYRPGRRLST